MIVLVNPRSARWNHRIPLSVLAVASGLEGKYPYAIVDENFDHDIDRTLSTIMSKQEVKYLALTVMPGPQLVRAVAISKKMKAAHPHLIIIWGGTFPTIHTDTVLSVDYVDYVVSGQGEFSFSELIDALEVHQPIDNIHGIAFHRDGKVIRTAPREFVHPDILPPLPYHRVNMQHYLARTYLGRRTIGYHSSYGCPFLCGFCAIAAVYEGRWLAKNPLRVADDLLELQKQYGIDSVEFFDDNFFVSEKRTRTFAEAIAGKGIAWWGDARIDTLMQYSDSTLDLMRTSGCTMIFMGAESSSSDTLELMNKGGTQTPDLVLEFTKRIKQFDIIPEYSFIFGSPSTDVDASIERDIQYIRKIKEINPFAEIIFYVYAPVFLPGATIFEEAKKHGFDYPRTLEEWVSPEWQHLDLRKESATPWLRPHHLIKIRNFERVLNAYYPTVSDLKLTAAKKQFLRMLSGWRYRRNFYTAPYEIRFVLSKILKYRQPEIEGAEQYA
ncbi:MAG: cobalamin B12-binding domain-containing protein [Ignavibacteriae bacterium]|nr:cobalamin B12-binding domain-containing protein [Ignavibacteria bacterium]MBI3363668.1 cobalamin B12-binding domain-containing protein [Ignavibacteriota bacterium]